MSKNNERLGYFLKSILNLSPSLSKFLSRKGVYEKFRDVGDNATFFLPSNDMIKQLNTLFNEKKYLALDSAMLSLLINDTYEPKKILQTEAKTYLDITSANKNEISFKNGEKANFLKKLDGYSFWQLQGSNIPTSSFLKKNNLPQINTFKGNFENKTVDEKTQMKFFEICKKKILKNNNFKEIVCDLFYTLEDEDKQIALCFIHGNPYAEFFLLIDSPFITIDIEKIVNFTCESTYENILQTKGNYLLSNGDTEEYNRLKEYLEDTNFIENNYELFYKNIAENHGSFITEDHTYNICHPKISEYLYTIEMFCFCMKKLGSMYEESDNKLEVLEKMIDLNMLTNIKSVENVIFEESENPIVRYEDFKQKFETFGLCLFCNHEKKGESEYKLKNRKKYKYKQKLKKYPKKKK